MPDRKAAHLAAESQLPYFSAFQLLFVKVFDIFSKFLYQVLMDSGVERDLTLNPIVFTIKAVHLAVLIVFITEDITCRYGVVYRPLGLDEGMRKTTQDGLIRLACVYLQIYLPYHFHHLYNLYP